MIMVITIIIITIMIIIIIIIIIMILIILMHVQHRGSGLRSGRPCGGVLGEGYNCFAYPHFKNKHNCLKFWGPLRTNSHVVFRERLSGSLARRRQARSLNSSVPGVRSLLAPVLSADVVLLRCPALQTILGLLFS